LGTISVVTLFVIRAEAVGVLTFTSVRVVGSHIPVSIHARVTPAPDDETFTDAPPGDQVVNHVGATFTLTAVLRADRVTVARCTTTQTTFLRLYMI